MAASFLRIGRDCSFKCLQLENWSTLRKAPAAAFSTKSKEPKIPPRRTHIKKGKTQPAIDIIKLLQERTHLQSPGKYRPFNAASTIPPKTSASISSPPFDPISATNAAVADVVVRAGAQLIDFAASLVNTATTVANSAVSAAGPARPTKDAPRKYAAAPARTKSSPQAAAENISPTAVFQAETFPGVSPVEAAIAVAKVTAVPEVAPSEAEVPPVHATAVKLVDAGAVPEIVSAETTTTTEVSPVEAKPSRTEITTTKEVGHAEIPIAPNKDVPAAETAAPEVVPSEAVSTPDITFAEALVTTDISPVEAAAIPEGAAPSEVTSTKTPAIQEAPAEPVASEFAQIEAVESPEVVFAVTLVTQEVATLVPTAASPDVAPTETPAPTEVSAASEVSPTEAVASLEASTPQVTRTETLVTQEVSPAEPVAAPEIAPAETPAIPEIAAVEAVVSEVVPIEAASEVAPAETPVVPKVAPTETAIVPEVALAETPTIPEAVPAEAVGSEVVPREAAPEITPADIFVVSEVAPAEAVASEVAPIETAPEGAPAEMAAIQEVATAEAVASEVAPIEAVPEVTPDEIPVVPGVSIAETPVAPEVTLAELPVAPEEATALEMFPAVEETSTTSAAIPEAVQAAVTPEVSLSEPPVIPEMSPCIPSEIIVETVFAQEELVYAPMIATEEGLVESEAVETPEAQLDPVQRLFLDNIREYSTRSKASGGLVDAGPKYEKALSEEMAKLQRLYGGGDLTEFPDFKFPEPKLDDWSAK